MIDIVELQDCIFQLRLLLTIRKRLRNEFPPIREIDLYEKATALLDEVIDPCINKLNLIAEGEEIDEPE